MVSVCWRGRQTLYYKEAIEALLWRDCVSSFCRDVQAEKIPTELVSFSPHGQASATVRLSTLLLYLHICHIGRDKRIICVVYYLLSVISGNLGAFP